MGRAPCCDERVALKKGPWTPDEDLKLVAYIQQHGHGSWRHLPEKAGLARCGKSCRLRWTNYLRPDIKRGRFTNEEDQLIIQLHAILGNRWSAIASHLPRRTDNEIKNYWNTHLKKRLAQMGIDPVTHKLAASSAAGAGLALAPAWTPLVSTQLTHSSQWHCALAEAEARLFKANPGLLTDQQLHTNVNEVAVPHPSAYFMRSWKTKVEDTLRPTFGSVKLDLQRETGFPKPVQDWNTALGLPSSAMAAAKPDLLEDMLTEDQSRAGTQFFDDFAASDLGAHQRHMGLENHFSPTSILHGPDSDSCSDNSFEFLHHDRHGYHTFPLIDDQAEISDVGNIIPDSFWQAGQHAERLLDELKSIGFDITTSSQPEFDAQY